MNNSIATAAPIEFINITPYNPLISKCQIKVCWVGDEPNPNKSIISKATAKELANSIPGSPIVGKFNEDTQDFEQHNKIIEIKDGKFQLKEDTFPYGFVDMNAKVWFQQFNDNGILREYLVTEGWLWTGQYPECQRVIDKGNNQSMELDKNRIDAHWTRNNNGNREFFIINEAIMSKLCILGENYKPCFEGANITAPKIEFSLGEDFKQQMLFIMNEIKNILNEGGKTSMNENEKVIVEGEENPEFSKDKDDEKVCPKCGKPLDDCECKDDEEEFAKKDEEEEKPEDKKSEEETPENKKSEEEEEKDKKAKYNLNEIPEYMEILDKYSNLESQINELNATIDTLKAENESLTNFKQEIERAEKEEMIKKFYMLSEEDVQDVKDNIDTYSLDDIEAKLSVICVRKKVNFNLDEDNKDNNDPTVYNLNNNDYSNDSAPEWVKSLRENAKNF